MTFPPIASPHGDEEPLPFKPPFRGLRIFVALDAAFLLLGALSSISLFLSRAHQQQAFAVGIVAVYVVLWSLLLWRLWHSSGVARAIFCWVNGASLLWSVFSHTHRAVPLASRWFGHVNQVFLALALIWLQLPDVKAHFRREKPV